jgi:hypothetical protein
MSRKNQLKIISQKFFPVKLNGYFYTITLKLKNMKKLFCTIVTDFHGVLTSPIVYHTRAVDAEAVEKYVREELTELGYEEIDIDDVFDIFSFPVRPEDIVDI